MPEKKNYCQSLFPPHSPECITFEMPSIGYSITTQARLNGLFWLAFSKHKQFIQIMLFRSTQIFLWNFYGRYRFVMFIGLWVVLLCDVWLFILIFFCIFFFFHLLRGFKQKIVYNFMRRNYIWCIRLLILPMWKVVYFIFD